MYINSFVFKINKINKMNKRNKNEHRNSRASYVPKGADETGGTGPIFLIFIVEGVFEDTTGPIFF